MNGNIGCVGLIFIALFIVWLFIRRRESEKGVAQFYKKHSFVTATDAPPIVREIIGATANPICLRGNLILQSGGEVPFHWWEWFVSSTSYGSGVPQNSITCFLAVSFPPNSVSEEFEQKAMNAMRTRGVWQNFESGLGLDMQTPIRAEKLADGTFVIFWQVLQQAKILEEKIQWLKTNVSASAIKNMQATFYKHDDYAALRKKFNVAWANLRLEMHYLGPKLDKEGMDEMAAETTFADANSPNEIAFTLTNQTISGEAIRLFSTHFGGKAYIVQNGFPVEDGETLEYWNDPFTLPLDKFTYGEFKQRFSERWTNLSIELYETAPQNGGLRKTSKKLADEYEMGNLQIVGDALHDYIYISDWGNSLKRGNLAATIKNTRLGIYAEGNLIYTRLKDFQAAENIQKIN